MLDRALCRLIHFQSFNSIIIIILPYLSQFSIDRDFRHWSTPVTYVVFSRECFSSLLFRLWDVRILQGRCCNTLLWYQKVVLFFLSLLFRVAGGWWSRIQDNLEKGGYVGGRTNDCPSSSYFGMYLDATINCICLVN